MALKYTLKVWLTSVFLTPLLIAFYLLSMDRIDTDEVLFTIGITTIFGFVASLPNFILLFLFIGQMQKQKLSTSSLKLLVNAFAILLTCALFFIIDLGLEPLLTNGVLIGFYCFTITLGIWGFLFREKK